MNVRLLSLGIQCIRSSMVTCNEDPILAHQVETKEKMARQHTAAAVIYRKVKLVCFRQCLAARSLLAIGLGIISIQAYCISCSDF